MFYYLAAENEWCELLELYFLAENKIIYESWKTPTLGFKLSIS
jgi:hypothetical protein